MSDRPPGRLAVLSGPGGVGKGAVVGELRKRLPHWQVTVSVTTRAPRPGERHGQDYRFVSDAEFDELIARGAFLEWAQFGGHRYGTPWTSVRDHLARGEPVLMELDVQGALQVKKEFEHAILVFLLPPDHESLRQRLSRRGSDSEEGIAERLRLAGWELAQASRFDHQVVNERVDAAAAEVARILEGR